MYTLILTQRLIRKKLRVLLGNYFIVKVLIKIRLLKSVVVLGVSLRIYPIVDANFGYLFLKFVPISGCLITGGRPIVIDG